MDILFIFFFISILARHAPRPCYCLMSSILFWNSAITEFMCVIIVPIQIDANIRILARKLAEVFLLGYWGWVWTSRSSTSTGEKGRVPILNKSVHVKPSSEDACIGINEQQDVNDSFGNSERIGKRSSWLCLVKETNHPVNPKNPIDPDNDQARHLLIRRSIKDKKLNIC